MFSMSKSNELSPLIKQSHLDISTIVRGQAKDNEGNPIIQVEATVALFTPAIDQKSAQVIKKVTVSAVDKDLETAQNRALVKAQELLGL